MIGEGDRCSEAQWLKAGLDVLAKEGSVQVQVDVLAAHLGISRGDFYRKFESRRKFLHRVFEHWAHTATEEFISNLKLRALPPKERLARFAQTLIDPDLACHEVAVAQLALQDEKAARAILEANRARLDFVRAAMEELGIGGDDLEMRTRMFTCYVAWARPMFWEMSLKRLHGLIGQQVEILTSR